jgi:hypothetical protein
MTTTLASAEVIQRRRFNIEQFDIQMASLDLLVEVAERRGADGAQAFARALAEFQRIQHDYIDQLTDRERDLTAAEVESMRDRLRALEAQVNKPRSLVS